MLLKRWPIRLIILAAACLCLKSGSELSPEWESYLKWSREHPASMTLSALADRKSTAYHEAGHVLVYWLTPTLPSVEWVSIISTEKYRGLTMPHPVRGPPPTTYPALLAGVAVYLAGNEAEVVAGLPRPTDEWGPDWTYAHDAARHMVKQCGMGERTGHVTYDDAVPISDLARGMIDRDADDLVERARAMASGFLTAHRQELDRVAAALLEKDVLMESGLKALLGPRPTAEP